MEIFENKCLKINVSVRFEGFENHWCDIYREVCF